MKKTTKRLLALILMGIIMMCFSSCYSSLKTGKYTIESVRGYTVNFKGVNGDWHVPTDTLRIGDTIFLKRVFREKDANVW